MAKVGDEVLNQFQKASDDTMTVVDPDRILKIGIIGTGWIAESHIESYLRMPDVQIVAATDLIEGKAEAFMKRYGVEGVHLYPDHKSMLFSRQG